MARFAGRRPGSRRGSTALVTAAVAAFVLPSCGDQKDASLCTAFAEFLEARATVQAARALDPSAVSAADAKDLAESYVASVQRLQHAADGRYGQQIEDLENAANDLLLTVSSLQDGADPATWRPLIEDDLDTAKDLAAQVQSSIEPSCNPDTSD